MNLKKVIALVLVFAMCLSMVPSYAFAGDDWEDVTYEDDANVDWTGDDVYEDADYDQTDDTYGDADDQTQDADDQTQDADDQTQDADDQTQDADDQTQDADDDELSLDGTEEFADDELSLDGTEALGAPTQVDVAQIMYVSGEGYGSAEVFKDLAAALLEAGHDHKEEGYNYGTLDSYVTLLNSAVLAQSVNLGGSNVTLDLNGKKLTLNDITNGTVTITGIGTISGTETQIADLKFADGYYYDNGQVKQGYRNTVSFYLYEGAESPYLTKVVEDGLRVDKPEDPIRTGYDFTGDWKDEDGYIWNFADVVRENKTLTAQWTLLEYTITYLGIEGDDFSLGQTNPTTYTVESEDITLINPSRSAQYFTGWTGTGLNEATKTVKIEKGSTGNREYTATWGQAEADVMGVGYATLAEAIAAANDNEEVTLLKDVTLSDLLVIEGGKKISLDLGGNTLTGGIDLYDADLTVGNGTIAGTVHVNGGTAANYNNFTLSDNAKIEADADYTYGVILWEKNANTAYGSTINLNGTVKGCVWVMGNITAGDSVINVNGTVEYTDDIGIALNGAATLNVNDGAVVRPASGVAAGTGIEVRAGTLNVRSGSTITGCGAETTVAPNGSGTTTVGAGIAVAQHTTNLPVTVNVEGGTISGPTAFNVANPQGNTSAVGTIGITGGSFTSTTSGSAVNVAVDETRVNGFISGGTFSSEVPAAYAASGYVPVDNGNGDYSVAEGWVVTFDPDNGDDTWTVTVAKDATVAKPATDPAKAGSVFAYWYKDGETAEFNFNNTPITANTTLTAKWSDNVWRIEPITAGSTQSGSTISFANKTVDYSPINNSNGRLWVAAWVGAKVIAPESVTALSSTTEPATPTLVPMRLPASPLPPVMTARPLTATTTWRSGCL